LVYPKKSRLWFDPKVYETDALIKIRIHTRSIVQKELLRWFGDIFSFDDAGDEIHVTPVRLAHELEKSLRQINGLATQIGYVLKEDWQLPQSKNNKFDFISITDEYDDNEHMMVSRIVKTKTTGKYYIVTREFVESKI